MRGLQYVFACVVTFEILIFFFRRTCIIIIILNLLFDGLTYLLLVTSVCLAASIWLLGHPRSDRHVSNLRHPDCCCRQAGKIHNVPKIGVEFRLKSNNRTRRKHTYTFWQSIEHSYRSPSKAIVFQSAQSTDTGMVYNTSSGRRRSRPRTI